MNFNTYGKYTIEESNENIERLEKEYINLFIELKKLEESGITQEEKNKKFIIDKDLLSKGLEIDAEDAKKRIATINVAQRDKLFKKSTKNYQQRMIHNKKAQNNLLDLLFNPLVNGKYHSIMNDTISVRVLREFMNIIKRNNENNLDSNISDVFSIAETVIKEYSKIINKVSIELDKLINEIKVSIDQGYVKREKEFKEFKKDLTQKISENQNEYDLYKDYEKAEKEVKSLKKANNLKEKISKLSIDNDVNISILESSIKTVNLLDIIETMQKMLTSILANVPQSKTYGNVTLDFSSLHDAVKNAEKLLNSKKILNENKLKDNGFNKEINKIREQEKRFSVISYLSKEMEKLTPDITGSYRKEIENNIENILINSGYPKEEWDNLKNEALDLAGKKQEDKRVKENWKVKETQKKLNREIAIKNRDMVSHEEFEQIKREAEIAANSRFPDANISNHNLNASERQEFINKYIDEKLSHIAAYKHDEKERNIESNEKISMDNMNKINAENITYDMMVVATEVLKANGRISSDDISKLNPSEISVVIECAKELRKCVGLDEIQVAELLANSLIVGKDNPNKEISQSEIIAQLNLLRYHNINNKINEYYKIENINKAM